MRLSERHTINNMLTLSAAAVLAVRAVAGGQFPDFDFVYVASRADNIEVEFGNFINFADSLAHDKHART